MSTIDYTWENRISLMALVRAIERTKVVFGSDKKKESKMGANEIIVASIRQLAAECHQVARDHGFWPEEGRNDGELIALIHSEVSELLEAVRHGNPPSDHLATGYSLAEEECADIIIRVLDMAYARNWNVAGALLHKIAFNRNREFKHGKAF